MAVIHQLLSQFRRGEPATESALRLQVLLRRLGHWGELLVTSSAPRENPLVRNLGAVRLRRTDWVLGHHAGASALTARLLLLGCQRAVVLDAHSAGDVSSGAQLAALASSTAFALAPSSAASSALVSAGHAHISRFSPYIEADRFAESRADPRLLRTLRSGRRDLVCGVAAGITAEELAALHRELRRLQPGAQLQVLAQPGLTTAELTAFRRQTRSLPGVRLLSALSHAERVAVLRSSDVWLSFAEDDLVGTQLLEAMAAGLPVLAYAAGATTEVLAGVGLAFTEKRFAFLAELVLRMAQDGRLRRRLLSAQERRLAGVSPASGEASLREALKPFVPGAVLPKRLRRRQRPRVAVVVQRYGAVTGGAEALARSVVERLSRYWEVTVLTTCAKDHLTWANALPPGSSTRDGVRVRRFPTRQPRNMRSLNILSRRLFGTSLDRGDEEGWVAKQGPLAPGLWRHLAEESHRYDGFLAFTYLYASTVWSVPLVGRRALVVPTVHDEPPLAFGVYEDVFRRPSVLFPSTPEEDALISRRFPHHARTRVVGAGIEAPARMDPRRFRRRFAVSRPYLLYVGRVEAGKGIPELLSFYASLRDAEPEAPDLVLAGDASLTVSGVGVRTLGRITESDKWDALAGATAVVVPSPLESLSLLALEAFAVGAPVVGNGHSDVVQGQLERSGAGCVYRDAASFRDAVRAVSRGRSSLARKGRAYAKKHQWSNVVQAYRKEMDRILGER
jgi:glycosyltransferase involved in cell wall biosynthesis